jgi:hypothetical protein
VPPVLAAAVEPVEPEAPADDDELDESSSEPPHAVSATESPAAPAAATTVRRAGPDADLIDALVMLGVPFQGGSRGSAERYEPRAPLVQCPRQVRTVSRS